MRDDDIFANRKGSPHARARAEWIADRIAAYRPESILEIGCGYGKFLRALRARLDVPLVGTWISCT